MTYTVRELKQAAYNAGFRGPNLVIAVAVSLAENQARDEKATHRNTDGTTDYGAWQINSVHGFSNLGNLQSNANAAYSVYQSQGWRAWTVFKSGAYKTKLARAQRAKLASHGDDVRHPTATGTDGTTSGTTDGGAGGMFQHQGDDPWWFDAGQSAAGAADALHFDTVAEFLTALADKGLWKRIGLVALALVIVTVGVLLMLSSNKNVQSIEKAAAVL